MSGIGLGGLAAAGAGALLALAAYRLMRPQGLRSKWARCAKALGVAEHFCHLDTVMEGVTAAPRKSTGTFRLLQWNLLADGLSQDGFSVAPVLADWPVAMDEIPTTGGGGEKQAVMLRSLVDAVREKDSTAKSQKLQALQDTYKTEASVRNLEAMVDFEGRKIRMGRIVELMDADVLTFQELDRIGSMRAVLGALGYVCGGPEAMRAAHAPLGPEDYHDVGDTPAKSTPYLEALRRRGLAFAPKVLSTASLMTILRCVKWADLAAAAASMGHPDKLAAEEPPKNHRKKLKSLLQDRGFQASGGRRKLLGLCGIADAADADDDGSAIFWKKDRCVWRLLHVWVYVVPLAGAIVVRWRWPAPPLQLY